jgi:hypothetical protein
MTLKELQAYGAAVQARSASAAQAAEANRSAFLAREHAAHAARRAARGQVPAMVAKAVAAPTAATAAHVATPAPLTVQVAPRSGGHSAPKRPQPASVTTEAAAPQPAVHPAVDAAGKPLFVPKHLLGR